MPADRRRRGEGHGVNGVEGWVRAEARRRGGAKEVCGGSIIQHRSG
jgi:hypothetical protein